MAETFFCSARKLLINRFSSKYGQCSRSIFDRKLHLLSSISYTILES